MLSQTAPTRLRDALLATALLVAGQVLTGCVDPNRQVAAGPIATAAPPVPEPAPPAAGPTLGQGPTKVGLILPLSGSGGGAVAAASLRNAAELALTEFREPGLTILVKDDAGTADGARQAAEQAFAEGAELLIGPLFAPSVSAAGSVARARGKPVIAFSTDAAVAGQGVYLLSFMAASEVDRVVDHAASQGRRSFAALVPETPYGGVVEAQFRESVARRGARVAIVERYASGQPAGAVERLAPILKGNTVDALLVADSGDSLAATAAALTGAGFDPARIKPIGTGVWNEPRALASPALAGGWFAAPDQAGFTAFATRYRARFGAEPTRIATLSFDAVSLAAALARANGGRFTDAALTGPAGFVGADGTFRFKGDGTNQRALAVLEIRNGAANVVSPPPRTLGSGM